MGSFPSAHGPPPFHRAYKSDHEIRTQCELLPIAPSSPLQSSRMATKVLLLAALAVVALANPLPDKLKNNAPQPAAAQPAVPGKLKKDTPQTKPIDVPQPTIVGGYSDISVDDEDVKTMANFAVASLNSSENSQMKLLRITSAARQVVAGHNYKLKIELTQADGDVRTCDVIVFDQPWTQTRKVSSAACIV